MIQEITNKFPIEIPALEINENEESINYATFGKRWNQKDIVVDNIFAYNITLNIVKDDEDQEPKSIEECRHIND